MLVDVTHLPGEAQHFADGSLLIGAAAKKHIARRAFGGSVRFPVAFALHPGGAQIRQRRDGRRQYSATHPLSLFLRQRGAL